MQSDPSKGNISKQQQIDNLVARINEIGSHIAIAESTVRALRESQDSLLAEWFKLEQDTVKPVHHFAKKRARTHSEVLELARARFDDKHRKQLLRVAKGDEKIADIIGKFLESGQ